MLTGAQTVPFPELHREIMQNVGRCGIALRQNISVLYFRGHTRSSPFCLLSISLPQATLIQHISILPCIHVLFKKYAVLVLS